MLIQGNTDKQQQKNISNSLYDHAWLIARVKQAASLSNEQQTGRMHNLNPIGLTLKLLLAVCILASKKLEVNAAGILPQYGIRPAQDFLFDMCAPPEPGQQHNTPWPVRVDDLCSSFGLNNPQLTEQACQVVDLLKMMLASPAAAPLKCQADAIPAPPAQDKDGEADVWVCGAYSVQVCDAVEGALKLVSHHRACSDCKQHTCTAAPSPRSMSALVTP